MENKIIFCPFCASDKIKIVGVYCSEDYYICQRCDKFFQVDDISESINKINKQ